MAYRATEKTRAAQAERREVLLAEAGKLVAAGGFSAASVKAIAENCGVSVGSVYSYFDGRSDLLAAVFRRGADQELNEVRMAVAEHSGAADRLRALVETFARRAIRGRQMAWSLLFEPVDPLVDEERLIYRGSYAELTTAILRDGIEEGELPDQHVGITAAALIGAISESLTGRLSPIPVELPDTFSDDAIVDAILQLCLRAVGFTA
ncbi:TetR/AcrR family transcriptional regulator [Rhodococcus sp. PvR099]|jgi:AcrR family transcriptional regulator|uniref:TetR/AcrR family transcriptional regulator n=1 Tax=Rhodococcus sp. PvR099 TaxID=2806602 RepID=UPI001AE731EF|nr:TetR/AcrR family transcriptional regulator [Rhodococcus sp. PvR099]MBP1159044.1 AcrR family transcriptional regulator [Rhodococcus sp. PvR099]